MDAAGCQAAGDEHTRNRHDMGEQDEMAVIRSQAQMLDIDPGRLVRLWPEIDVFGRLRRLVAAEDGAVGRLGRARPQHPAA
jgi:hypothetical protein